VKKTSSWFFLFFGLAIWVAVQSYLIYGPLSQRDQFPEVDDSLAYLVRTQVMEECSSLDCKALLDLKNQFDAMPPGPDMQRQSEIAGFAFPLYHPLFSTILLSINQITHDLFSTFRILWLLSPLFWGIAFACFLTSLWGRTVAGLTLILIAFKIFPGPGLHYLTPSNLTIMIALLIWARILTRNGSAPVTLILGSLLMVAIHPLGILLTLITIFLALALSEKKKRKQLYIMLLFSSVVCIPIVFFTSLADQFQVYQTVNPAHILSSFQILLNNIGKNFLEIVIQLIRYKTSFFGSLLVLFPATLVGVFYLDKGQRKNMIITLSILFLFLLSSLCHSHALTPNGSLFFRLLIPFAVILFGALPHVMYIVATNALNYAKNTTNRRATAPYSPKSLLSSVLILALLSGYILETIVPGMIHIQAMREHMIKRQPLSFHDSQVQLLLSKANPEDKILYTSTMIMASYFAHNCLQLGAIYYHPAFAKSEATSLLLQQKNLRFAVAYNPAVFHPSYTGLDEKNRCITSPEISFTPLSEPRRSDPINQEGSIPVKNFHWIEIRTNHHDAIKEIRVFVTNPGKEISLKLIQHARDFPQTAENSTTKLIIPAAWNDWITFSLRDTNQGDTYRLLLPKGDSKATIGGISFNNEHFWPWSHHATMILQGKDTETGRVELSFDPSDLLPTELENKPVTVIHDQGSSVLLEFVH
jgi:hypothetical protein